MQSRGRGHDDDVARSLRYETAIRHRLAENEDTGGVERHDAVPGFDGVQFGRCAPARAGVVDQDVDTAAMHGDFLDQRRYLVRLRQIADRGESLDALLLEPDQ